jgi:hypothetical protein
MNVAPTATTMDSINANAVVANVAVGDVEHLFEIVK